MAKVFFSYSHDDENFRDQLEKHLAALKHEGLIESWHDRQILAGSEVDDVIDRHLESADIVLLLVSASFLASPYCFSIEMKRALQRHKEGSATVIPVIVRPCDWKKTPLGSLLAAPRDGKPVSTWPNFDEAYTDIAQQVRRVVENRGDKKDAAAHTRDKPSNASARIQSAPRSSNLRVRKEFTDVDRDSFLHDSFEFIAHFFEASLSELSNRHADIEHQFRRIHANHITAAIYRSGTRVAQCAIRLGGPLGRGISYSHDASSSGNSFNEMLSVDNDDLVLFMKPMMGQAFGGSKEKLSAEQAAEYYWAMLIRPLQ